MILEHIGDPEVTYRFCSYVKDTREMRAGLYYCRSLASLHFQYAYCRYVKDRKEMWNLIADSTLPEASAIRFSYCMRLGIRRKMLKGLNNEACKRLLACPYGIYAKRYFRERTILTGTCTFGRDNMGDLVIIVKVECRDRITKQHLATFTIIEEEWKRQIVCSYGLDKDLGNALKAVIADTFYIDVQFYDWYKLLNSTYTFICTLAKPHIDIKII